MFRNPHREKTFFMSYFLVERTFDTRLETLFISVQSNKTDVLNFLQYWVLLITKSQSTNVQSSTEVTEDFTQMGRL